MTWTPSTSPAANLPACPRLRTASALIVLLSLLDACSTPGSGADALTAMQDAEVPSPDAAIDAVPVPSIDAALQSCADMSADCAAEFGALFTQANGRADGTLVALVEPADTQCALVNNTHVVLQLSILGQVQRLVVAIDDVAVHKVTADLIGPAFAEGWHTGMNLDYPADLGAHSTDFASTSMDEAVLFVCSEMAIGEPVSVFAYSDGNHPASAHQIHRNDIYPDGAIVAHPTSVSPTYLLFRYSDQVF